MKKSPERHVNRLAALAAELGTTLAAAAGRAGLDPRLVEQAAEGIQPLPIGAVDALAYGLGTDPSEVKARVGLVEDRNRVVYRPRTAPVIDEAPPLTLAPTAPVETQTSFTNPPGLWVGALDMYGTRDGTVLYDRVLGSSVAARPFAATATDPVHAAMDLFGFLWFGCAGSGPNEAVLTRLDPSSRAVVHERIEANPFESLIVEPGTGSLWASFANEAAVQILDLVSGNRIVGVPITEGGNPVRPKRGCASVGALWYAAVNQTTTNGRLVRVDPGTLTAQVSTGTAMASSVKCCTSDGTYIYVADDVGIWRVPISTMVVPASRWVTLAVANPGWVQTDDVLAFAGQFFAVGRVSGSNTSRLARINVSTAVQAEGRTLGLQGRCRLVGDQVSLYVVDPTPAMIRRLNPTSIGADLGAIQFSGGTVPACAVVTP